MLTEDDNFIDIAYLKKQDLSTSTHRYKICQKFCEYLKTLGYVYDISFDSFLFPSVKETRKLLGFLFEFIFNRE